MGEDNKPAALAKSNAEKLAEAAATLKTALESLTPIWEELAKTVRRIGASILQGYELTEAIHWAKVYNPRLARFYLHTKKGRIRKKYAKRILAWYREEVLGNG